MCVCDGKGEESVEVEVEEGVEQRPWMRNPLSEVASAPGTR